MGSEPSTADKQARGWQARVERGLGALAVRNHRRPGLTLLGVAVLVGVALFFARTLSLNANLVDLLPRSFQSVQDIRALEQRFGGLGWVVVVGEGAEPEALRRFADDLAPKLEALPGIRFVESRRNNDFFSERGLYFLSEEDLREVHRRLEARIQWEKQRANPLYVDLTGEAPPSLDFSDLEAKYGAGSLQRLSNGDERYYLDASAQRVVLLAKPEGSSADLSRSRVLVDEVRQLVDATDLKAYGPDFRVSLTGTFVKKLDQQRQIGRDIAVASGVAMVLMLLYLAFHFRSALAVGLVLAPVGAGLAWTYGMVGVAYGQVNLLTGFLGAILGGLGVEHGIHLLGRYLFLRGRQQSSEDAVREAFRETGSAALISALVAALTFLVLGTSEFRAFREFGVIAGVGMLVLVAAYVLVLPAVLGLVTRWGWRPRGASTAHKDSPLGKFLVRRRAAVSVLAGLVVLGLVAHLPRVRFNYDFGALEDQGLPSFVLDKQVTRLIGYSQSPVVMLTDSPEEERAVVRELRERKARLGDASTVDFVASMTELVPERQQEKRPLLRDIGALLEDVPEGQLTQEQRARVAQLRRQTQAEPFTHEDIPRGIRQQFQGVRGDQSGFVLVYPRISLGDGEAVRAMAREVREVRLPGGKHLSAAGEPMVLADILEMVTHEAPRILVGATLAVLLAMWVTLGRLRLALLCMLPTVVSLLALVGLMPLLGVQFNYLNILVIPVLIGTTVDAGVHLLTNLGRPGSNFVTVYSETGRAICGGLLTSAVGFGALFLADHPGLNSVGALANLGFGVNLLIMLVAFPSLLLVLSERRRRRRPVPPPVDAEARHPPPGATDAPSPS